MIEFQYVVRRAHTHTVGDLQDVIRRIEIDVVGTQEGVHFALPQTIDLGEPDPASFVPFTELTEQNVLSWLGEDNPELNGVKAIIRMTLPGLIEKTRLQEKPLPWHGNESAA